MLNLFKEEQKPKDEYEAFDSDVIWGAQEVLWRTRMDKMVDTSFKNTAFHNWKSILENIGAPAKS